MTEGQNRRRRKGWNIDARMEIEMENEKPFGMIDDFACDCIRNDYGSRVAAARMYLAYTAWCSKTQTRPMTATAFGLEAKHKWRRECGRIHRYVDVALPEFPDVSDRRLMEWVK